MHIIYNNKREVLTPETLKQAEEFAHSTDNRNNPYNFIFETEIDGQKIQHDCNIVRNNLAEQINRDWESHDKYDVITYIPIINY